jgi:hypothetical protein
LREDGKKERVERALKVVLVIARGSMRIPWYIVSDLLRLWTMVVRLVCGVLGVLQAWEVHLVIVNMWYPTSLVASRLPSPDETYDRHLHKWQ